MGRNRRTYRRSYVVTTDEMLERGVYQVRLYSPEAISVQLRDGSLGVGKTFREALTKAEAGVSNVRKVAA